MAGQHALRDVRCTSICTAYAEDRLPPEDSRWKKMVLAVAGRGSMVCMPSQLLLRRRCMFARDRCACGVDARCWLVCRSTGSTQPRQCQQCSALQPRPRRASPPPPPWHDSAYVARRRAERDARRYHRLPRRNIAWRQARRRHPRRHCTRRPVHTPAPWQRAPARRLSRPERCAHSSAQHPAASASRRHHTHAAPPAPACHAQTPPLTRRAALPATAAQPRS